MDPLDVHCPMDPLDSLDLMDPLDQSEWIHWMSTIVAKLPLPSEGPLLAPPYAPPSIVAPPFGGQCPSQPPKSLSEDLKKEYQTKLLYIIQKNISICLQN